MKKWVMSSAAISALCILFYSSVAFATNTKFSVKAPDAGKVTLAGSFNEWNMDEKSLDKGEDGTWSIELDLKPGKYEYKFLQDGDWNKLNKDNRTIDVGEGEAGDASAPDAAVEVTFRYDEAADAAKVGIGGEFNEWKWEESLMEKGDDGAWTLKLNLKPGEYAYKIVVDGDWRFDPKNPLKKTHGENENSMIRVKAPGSAAAGSSKKTAFSVKAPDASKVSLAGSFNEWKADDIFLEQAEDGMWSVELDLKPGAYEYKFLQDGDWDKLNKDNRKINVAGAAAGASKKTAFSVKAPGAGKVSIAGSFNEWKPDGIFLEKGEDGKWSVDLDLKPGNYEYKFLQDGDWDKLNKDNLKITVP